MSNIDFKNKAELHKYYSTHCFNEAWTLMDKTDRTTQESEDMIHYAMASLFHWSKRKDCTDKHKSIGSWQISRCFVLIGNLDKGEQYGKLCLNFSKKQSPYFKGYAHETLARVYHLMDKTDLKNKHLIKANELNDQIENDEEKQLLLNDLKSIM